MELTEKERQVLSGVVRTLRTRFGDREVLLYGSAARGQLDEGSDIDLLVVLSRVDWEIQKQIIGVCYDAELECGRAFSPAAFTADELERTPLRASPFVLTARREGRSL